MYALPAPPMTLHFLRYHANCKCLPSGANRVTKHMTSIPLSEPTESKELKYNAYCVLIFIIAFHFNYESSTERLYLFLPLVYVQFINYKRSFHSNRDLVLLNTFSQFRELHCTLFTYLGTRVRSSE